MLTDLSPNAPKSAWRSHLPARQIPAKALLAAANAAALALLTAAAPALAGEFGPTTQTLPATGLTIDLPTGWVARETVFKVPGSKPGTPGTDLITRVSPEPISIFMNLIGFGGHTCTEWFTHIAAADPGAHPVQRPPYLPTGWFPGTTEGPGNFTPGATMASSCIDTTSGLIIATMQFKGSNADPDVATVTPILVSIAKATGATSSAPVVAPPVAPPPAPPPTAPPPAAPIAPPAVAPPAPPIAASVEPAPAPAPAPTPAAPSLTKSDEGKPPHEEEPSDTTDRSGGGSPRVDLALFVLRPTTGDPNAFGGTLAIDDTHILGGAPIGFAIGIGGGLGFTAGKNIPFDARFAMGLGLTLGPVTLMPLLGIGLDSISGGDSDSYKVPFAASWFVEGRLRINVAHAFGMEGAVSRAARGGFTSADDAVPHESRVVARLTRGFDEFALSAGFQFVDYGDATSIGGLAGLSF